MKKGKENSIHVFIYYNENTSIIDYADIIMESVSYINNKLLNRVGKCFVCDSDGIFYY